MNSLQCSYHNLTGRTAASHHGNQNSGCHSFETQCGLPALRRHPPVRHSTHHKLGATSTPYYFTTPLNPSARQQMKEMNAEKKRENGFLTDEGKCLSLVNGTFQVFWGLCAIVGPAGWTPSEAETSSCHRILPSTDQLEPPTENTLKYILQLKY